MATYPAYIPSPDADFSAWLNNFANILTADPVPYGLTAGDAIAVQTVTDTWSAAYALATDPATRTTPTVADKDNARASAEAVVRPYAVTISQSAAITDMLKADIGVTIRSLVPTPIPAPVDAPAVSLQAAIVGLLTLNYKVPAQVGKAKPFGATGVEIWTSIGDTYATDPAQTNLRQIVTRSPFRLAYNLADSGKKMSLYARYTTRSGPGGVAQSGPWSPQFALVLL